MSAIAPHLLTNAVAAICPEIVSRVESRRAQVDERQLWWELSACVLSSQVPYVLATAAADAIDRTNLLLEGAANNEQLAAEITLVLRTGVTVHGQRRAHRFPVIRGRQLAAARASVAQAAHSLGALLYSLGSAADARNWLVTNLGGLGPKQASMFLRNVGFTYDLAVLDRHVLRYMDTVGIHVCTDVRSGLALYRLREASLSAHAQELGYPVGLLDWAIWIVMRAANRLQRDMVIA